ncbi:hypothetical protein [Actinoplanes sp. OR16]|uniref:hypothetical protein n=1 Tax=Actinoplanes sp. OR16 TaxID=946334 RepID=UPI000FD7B672|nr:hypothetical protein [Actinoplanes sp. OR16]
MARVLITGSADGLGRAAAVAGDPADIDQTRSVASQVGESGPIDAVIHNAGVYSGPAILPVNVVAPYLLTALLPAPRRLIYLSSGMHRGGRADLGGLDWTGRRSTGTYSTSKLFVTALALAVARLRPGAVSNAVDPGWVPTRSHTRPPPTSASRTACSTPSPSTPERRSELSRGRSCAS